MTRWLTKAVLVCASHADAPEEARKAAHLNLWFKMPVRTAQAGEPDRIAAQMSPGICAAIVTAD